MMRPLLVRPRDWPLAWKLPLLAAGLTIAVAVVISQTVLARLARDQEVSLKLLAAAYLDGLSAVVLPAVIRRDIWEVFDSLDRARSQYAGLEVRYAVVTLPDGTVLAGSDPTRFPVRRALPPDAATRFAFDAELTLDDGLGRAWLSRTLRDGDVPLGRILVEIGIERLLTVRHEVLVTLVLVNTGLTLLFAVMAYAAVKRMLRPLMLLGRHVQGVGSGHYAPISDATVRTAAPEFARLFRQFNTMAATVAERQELSSRLADEEKYAQLGKLASGMAHEVNNPLGGMLVVLDSLAKHGGDPEVRRTSLEFLRRGLAGIQGVVRAALVTYKGSGNPAELSRSDIDDLRFLVQHETGSRLIDLRLENQLPDTVPLAGSPVRQIALNLLLNACSASPPEAVVTLSARVEDGALQLDVADRGPGLPPEIVELLQQPALGVPPPGHRGLGLWTAMQLAGRLGGRISSRQPLEGGAVVSLRVPLARSHQLVAA